ncbi:MAG: diguanylate cyclase [Gordonia sp. (in: high G+C Gram-positive bacteria)]
MYKPHFRLDAAPPSLRRLSVRVLRCYLVVTTLSYAVGVYFTLVPPQPGLQLANPTGGVIAIVLGVAALGWLAVRPSRPTPAVLAACVATPVVIGFHVRFTASLLCVVAAMFLAMYIRANYRPRTAWCLIGGLAVGCAVALAVSPAQVYAMTVAVFGVMVIAAAEAFGVLIRALLFATSTDPLTEVYNRFGWDVATADLIERRRRSGGEAAFLLLDIDDFKKLNDAHGHYVGDRRLVTHAKTCLELLPSDAVLARIGGDEFAVLAVVELSSDADVLLSVLRKGLPDTTIGLATSPVSGADLTDLYHRSDDDLTSQKRRRSQSLSRR